MHPLLPMKNIISIKYYTGVDIDTFKRFALPANDNLIRATEFYKLLYTSIDNLGILDPILCYDIANVDLDNLPTYRNRKLYGAYILRGNIRWLVCKDLNITTINAIVVKVNYGVIKANRLFTGTTFTSTTVTDFTLSTKKENLINSCFSNYNSACVIDNCLLKMKIPSLTSISAFRVYNEKDILDKFNAILPTTDYSESQRFKETSVNLKI